MGNIHGHATARNGRRPQASTQDKKRRSVRAGTNQAQRRDGARVGGAARRVNCQVAIHASGRSTSVDRATDACTAETSGQVNRQTKQVQASTSGADTFKVGLD